MTTDTASFAHTEPLASHRPAPAIGPVTATRRTRIVYCMALIGMPLGMLFASRSWVGMVFGGGPITTLGPVAFFLIAAAVLYRIYRVARYPSALDARPPSVLGRILRGLAWIVMAVGAAGMAGLFLGGPLAVLLFGTGGPDGIVVFAAGIVAVVLASVGWIGCVIFEASRLFGTRVASAQPRTRRQRLQDWSVLAVVVVLAVVPVTVFKLLEGETCFDLAACVAQVEGGVSRRLAVPLAAPVTLQTNIEGIEYRQLHGKKEWVRTEIPAFSLLRAGHPVATTSAPVQVSLQATPVKKGVAVVLTVRENGEQTARFTTTFGSAARIVPSSNGRSKVAITLGPRTSTRSGRPNVWTTAAPVC